ncbi:protein PET100 homolog, mitochondrial [Anabrus simplex]|uniref:protein PET100 homolog, mitochondrial n=1 Tax=Anabrus simplex TaxID=316456 RepID=UPI0034DCCEEB
MGGWVLEVAKMALYLSFPVGMFHYFNQPEYFENWVTKTRRELYPPENVSHREEIQDCIRKLELKRERELLKILEENENKASITK